MKYILITALLMSSLWSFESNKNAGLSAFKKKNFETAIIYLEKVPKENLDYDDSLDYEDSIKPMLAYSYSQLGYKEVHKHKWTNAIKYFKKAYLNGNQYACDNIGGMYRELKDRDNAIKWYKRGAAEGSPTQADSQLQLANLYFNLAKTPGVQANFQEAVKYFRLSSANGNKLAKKNLGIICKNMPWVCK